MGRRACLGSWFEGAILHGVRELVSFYFLFLFSHSISDRAPCLFSPFYSVCGISHPDGDTHVQNKTFLLSKLPWKHPPGHPAAQFLGDPQPSHVYSEDWPGQLGPLVHAWWSLTQGRFFWERSFSSSQHHPMNKEDRVLEGLQIPVQAATAGTCQSVLIQAVDFLTIS